MEMKYYVGRIIRNITIEEHVTGQGSRIRIIGTDGTGLMLTTKNERIEILPGREDSKFLANLMKTDVYRDEAYKVVAEATYDESNIAREDIKYLFVKLWTDAGNGKYDKSDWRRLNARLNDLGIETSTCS